MGNGKADCEHSKKLDEFGQCQKCGYCPTMMKLNNDGTKSLVKAGESLMAKG